MPAPTINLNGSRGSDLLKEYENASKALDDACKAIQAITVHGRDYDASGWRQATEAKLRLLKSIEASRLEIESVAINVIEQIHARESR